MTLKEKVIEAMFSYQDEHGSIVVDKIGRANHLIANGVAPVVHCRGCIGKANWYKQDYGYTICGLSGLYVVEDNDFCSYGERRAE